MKVRSKIFALLMSLTMVMAYMPAFAFAADGQTTSNTLQLNQKVTVKASRENMAELFFDAPKEGGYQLDLHSTEAQHVRVDVLVEDPENEDEPWRVLDELDFDGEEQYDENDELIGELVDDCFPFYAEQGQTYKITLETSFDESDVNIDVTMKESTLAGIKDGFKFNSVKARNEDGEQYYASRIAGYTGSETNKLVVPSTLNGSPVEEIASFALEGGKFKSLVVSENIKMIDGDFLGYSNEYITSVSLPSTLELFVGDPFRDCPNLESVTFPEGSDYFTAEDGLLIWNTEKSLIASFGGHKDTVEIPSNVRTIGYSALDNITPKVVKVPEKVRAIDQLPESIQELHVANANCTLSEYAIPYTTDEETGKNSYTATVYAPAGGSLETFCNEEGIPFTVEGTYDPDASRPMDDPIALNTGDTSEQFVEGLFDTRDGHYQDFTFTATLDGPYGLNVDAYNITGETEETDAFTLVLNDTTSGKDVTPLLSAPTGTTMFPCNYYNLTKGHKYTMTFTATEAAIADDYNCTLDIYLYTPNAIGINGDPWDGYLSNGSAYDKATLVLFHAPLSGEYTIDREYNAPDDESDLCMYLFEMNADGTAKMIAQKQAKQIKATFTEGKTYYMAIVLQGPGGASGNIMVKNDQYVPEDPDYPEDPDDPSMIPESIDFHPVTELMGLVGDDAINGNLFFSEGSQFLVTFEDGHTEVYECIEFPYEDENGEEGVYVGYFLNGDPEADEISIDYEIENGTLVKGDNNVILSTYLNGSELRTDVNVIGVETEDEIIDTLVSNSDQAVQDAESAADEEPNVDADDIIKGAENVTKAADKAADSAVAAAEEDLAAAVASGDEEAITAAQNTLKAAESFKAATSKNVASAKRAAATSAGKKASAAKAAAQAAAAKPGQAAVNAAALSKQAADEALAKAVLSKDAADAALASAQKVLENATEDEKAAAQQAVNAAQQAATDAETALGKAKEAATDAAQALTNAQNGKAAADAAAARAKAAAEAQKRAQEAAAAKKAAEQALIAANNGIIDPTLPKVKIKGPKKAKKSFTAQWKKLNKKQQKKVKGIEIEYSLTKDFQNPVFKATSKKKANIKVKKLQSKKTYYVRAHTYVIRNGQRYVSNWSATKKVKVK